MIHYLSENTSHHLLAVTVSGYNSSTGTYTVVNPGYYEILTRVGFYAGSGTSEPSAASILINSSVVITENASDATAASKTSTNSNYGSNNIVTWGTYLATGATISIQGVQYSGTSNSVDPTSWISIKLLGASVGGGGSGITRTISSISTATTAGATALTDYVYLVSGTTTLTLPTAVGNTNRYTVKNTGGATVTIATTSSQTIDGSTTATLPVANTALDLISDNANWRIV